MLLGHFMKLVICLPACIPGWDPAWTHACPAHWCFDLLYLQIHPGEIQHTNSIAKPVVPYV